MTSPATATAGPASPGPASTAAALDAFATRAVRFAATREISLTTASTLATLVRSGPLRLSDLAAREGVAQPSMTALVSRLERGGLAGRAPDPSDGRAVMVAVTDAGRAAVAARRERRAGALVALLERADPGDRSLIEAAAPALARLASVLDDDQETS